MNLISPVHILFIAAFALIFLGPKRLPELARGLGTGMREFRNTLNGEVRHHDVAGELDIPGNRDALEHDDAGSFAPPPAGPFS
jgi:sec-independent protein translocase protein TatA